MRFVTHYIPVQLNFRELGIWLICMAIGTYGVVSINKATGLIGTEKVELIAKVEVAIVIGISYAVARMISKKLGKKAEEKVSLEMKSTEYKGKE